MTITPLGVSVPDAAKMLGVSKNHLWDLIREGTVTTYRLGQRRLVPVTEIERIVRTAEAIS